MLVSGSSVSRIHIVSNVLTSHYKSFKLIGLHPLCAVLFTAGYAMREFGAFNYLYNTRNLMVFIFSQVFIFVCP